EGRFTFNRAYQAPHDAYETDVTVTLFSAKDTHDGKALAQRKITTDEYGRFTFNLAGIAPGPYNVLVKPARALPILVTAVIPALGEIDFGEVLDGDVDGDSAITKKDADRLQKAFKQTKKDRDFDDDADLDRDGVVWLLDFSVLSFNSGRQSPAPPGQGKKETVTATATRSGTVTTTHTVTPTTTRTATPTASPTYTVTPTPTAVPGEVTQRITTSGGKVQTALGFTLDIPAGAVTSDVDVEFKPRSAADPTDLLLNGRLLQPLSGAQITGPFNLRSTFDLTARSVSNGRAVTSFATPLRLSMPFDKDTVRGKVILVYLDEATNQWVELPNQSFDRDAGTVSADTDHFTAFGQIEYFDSDTGTATGGTVNSLIDTSKTWSLDRWSQWTVTITAGTGAGQTRIVKQMVSGVYGTANTYTELFVTVNWTTIPDATSQYAIGTAMRGDNGTTSAAGTTTTIVDSTKSWVTNEWFGRTVTINSETRQISSNTSTVLTLASALSAASASGAAYVINPAVPGVNDPVRGPKLFAEGFKETTTTGFNSTYSAWHRLGTTSSWSAPSFPTAGDDGLITMPQNGMLVAKNSDNYVDGITIVLPMKKTNASGNGIGGIVWGYQGSVTEGYSGSTSKYFALGKYNNDAGGSPGPQSRFFFDACSGITCNHDTGGNVTTLSNQTSGSSGTATGGTTSTLTDSSKAWTVDAWKGWFVTITGGTGAGQTRNVWSNTATSLTVSANWTTAPNATSTYTIWSG
ncbi:MAG TPA: hypothetical protein VGW38_22790, partial [Chloroflexota bacterium]|nr:hypothetical protein [Chloroflexota bacterium]